MTGFTRLDRSTAEHWADISAAHLAHYQRGAPIRIMDHLRSLGDLGLGFPCDQLHHSLMTATLARQAGASDEHVVVALCHDIGKTLSVPNHAGIGAAFMKPYVSADSYEAILHHQEFQGAYYFQHFGSPTDLRDQYRATSWFALAERLVDEWDMPAFDPDFTVDPLESFEPELLRLFSTPRMM